MITDGDADGAWGDGLTASQEEAADLDCSQECMDAEHEEFLPVCELCCVAIADAADMFCQNGKY